jgi:glycosyltransferase involved in cell wall biosynthesis
VKILVHPMHTAYDFEFAKLGHQFDSMNGTWDTTQRSKPSNWNLIGQPSGHYDLAVTADMNLIPKMRQTGAEVIFNQLSDWVPGEVPDDIESKMAIITFLGKEPAARWKLKNESKKRVIAMGVDGEVYKGYSGAKGGVLTIGGCLPRRPAEKGVDNLIAVDRKVDVTLMGPLNDGLRCSKGMVPYEQLLQMYRDFSVYFNPSPVIGISVAEALMVGMPVVTFRTINLKDLIQDGRNGYVVDTAEQAVDRIRMLLANPGLRVAISAAARTTAIRVFGLGRFISEWNTLFNELVRK